MAEDQANEQQAEELERWQVLSQLEEWLETPMVVLSFVWLLLVLVELIWSTAGVFSFVGTAIWIVFIGEFLLRLVLAPDKLHFIRRNPITLIALVAPAFRFFRILKFLRLARGLRLLRIVGTANRSLNALRMSFGRRGLGYVIGATVLIVMLGAGGMLAFEPADEVAGGFATYGDALWWTAMIVTTMGSGFWPETAEGRVLTFLLTLYGYAVFSYITASFATFFIGQEAQSTEGEMPGVKDFRALQVELASLREELAKPRPQSS
jgi:voltage-gated potassium channel